ncbi:MFS transporter [Microbacterium sp. zg.Y1090]|uniref:MFS transporter n=1 Tax=Microbacterium TaxID=33882 RepID=UPI00214BC450|nr:MULTISPECIES: MFS transporter [unclassified Microbacterium]MCR2813116.1 MFS transporter [Microbacterium sp. zg.Y1084]MCR2819429.1 MFS transporter [Microbacterium sp. zg.Y1090]MDL5487026.1 MFS transporter [Microbacterium sp. zg-Y1211]WIM28406.1 MFS transporter [Microbacterium sp. zg-Y1090]
MTRSPADGPSFHPPRSGGALAVVGIVLFAFSLRSAVASLSPLVGLIAQDFPLPAAVLGLIGTVPPVCFAVFGLLAPLFERRFGLEKVAVAAISVVALGLVTRGFATGSLTLLVATAMVFAGVGVGNILLPPLVKKYFPRRVGLLTTVYSTTMAVATFTPPLVAVPLADLAGWRVSLGAWAVFAVVATLPWVLMLRRARDAAPVDVPAPTPRLFARLWRLPLAWALAVAFSVSSTLAYTSFGWLPTILVDVADVTPRTAGALLSLFALMGLPASLIVPLLVARLRAERVLFAVAVVAGLAGLGGLLLAPAAAPVLWVALVGTAPLLFPMILVMLGLRTRSHETAVALSGFVQSIGYAIAAVFPLATGLLHDATGSWTLPLWVLMGAVVAAIPAGYVVTRARTIEDEWERRYGAW